MVIRPATKADAPAVARLLLLAMEDIVHAFIGTNDNEQALAFMEHLVARNDNQYGWPHVLLAEETGTVVAAACVYEGARLHALRAPVLHHLRTHYERTVQPEDETGPGEWYIDTLGVDPTQQGKGLGSALLRGIIQTHVHEQGRTLGLLVDEDNPAARKLYLRLGFTIVGTRPLMGKRLEHLQYRAPQPSPPR